MLWCCFEIKKILRPAVMIIIFVFQPAIDLYSSNRLCTYEIFVFRHPFEIKRVPKFISLHDSLILKIFLIHIHRFTSFATQSCNQKCIEKITFWNHYRLKKPGTGMIIIPQVFKKKFFCFDLLFWLLLFYWMNSLLQTWTFLTYATSYIKWWDDTLHISFYSQVACGSSLLLNSLR